MLMELLLAMTLTVALTMRSAARSSDAGEAGTIPHKRPNDGRAANRRRIGRATDFTPACLAIIAKPVGVDTLVAEILATAPQSCAHAGASIAANNRKQERLASPVSPNAATAVATPPRRRLSYPHGGRGLVAAHVEPIQRRISRYDDFQLCVRHGASAMMIRP